MKYLYTLILLLTIFNLSAQNLTDVIRYSNVEFGATGRAIGTGNSFSAIGADFSLIGSNPAGLAVFRRSEMVITPGLRLGNTNANISEDAATTTNDNKTGVGLDNFGIVFASYKPAKKWKTFNFGLGINRIASLGNDISYAGSTTGSISDRWLELAEDFDLDELDPFEAGLAFDAGVLLEIGPGEYESDYQFFRSTNLNKSQTINQSGYISEFGISLASSYKDKLYIGGMIGLPFLFFNEERTYNEIDENGTIDFFDDLEFQENLSASGAGINFKLGLIYRFSQKLRLGLAAHTATVYNIEEEFSTSIDYNFTDGTPMSFGLQESPAGNFEYSLRTPWRLIASAGTIVAQRGFISAEVEFVDYSFGRFNFDSEAGSELARQERLNNEISSDLNSAINLRLGGEWTYNIYRFRAGANLLGAIADDLDNNLVYNAGLGLRKNTFFMDLGYRFVNTEGDFFAYQTSQSSSQLIQNRNSKNSFILTFGWKI